MSEAVSSFPSRGFVAAPGNSRARRVIQWLAMGGPITVGGPNGSTGPGGLAGQLPPAPAPSPSPTSTAGTPFLIQVLEDAGPLLLAGVLTTTVCILAIETKPVPELLSVSLGTVLGYYFRARLGSVIAGGRTP